MRFESLRLRDLKVKIVWFRQSKRLNYYWIQACCWLSAWGGWEGENHQQEDVKGSWCGSAFPNLGDGCHPEQRARWEKRKAILGWKYSVWRAAKRSLLLSPYAFESSTYWIEDTNKHQLLKLKCYHMGCANTLCKEKNCPVGSEKSTLWGLSLQVWIRCMWTFRTKMMVLPCKKCHGPARLRAFKRNLKDAWDCA